ncbi:hypothetical protein OE88DRAFT_1084925 [Heliocybe sulcata]|uniref:Protein-S-isoprenylcysteine O-methyltransferase n=1 Tax=Heliocybe sulcata TaxID=5364 RepID=A0A5C3MM77_9AGAM|nr:hypothetical protein OE88DRAFT_1084925 [Heliocybe sulcata]
MSLLRVPFILASAIGIQVASSSPNKVLKEETTKYAGVESSIWPTVMPTVLKGLSWTGALCETAVALSSAAPTSPFTQHILASLVLRPSWAISAIRLRCFHELGNLFTFQLSIRREHKLITSGPYAYVRHPSYTAGLATVAGIFTNLLGPGSWLRECGWLQTNVGSVIMGIPAIFMALSVSVLVWRAVAEDAQLRQEFGEQWDEWARRVPYRLMIRGACIPR